MCSCVSVSECECLSVCRFLYDCVSEYDLVCIECVLMFICVSECWGQVNMLMHCMCVYNHVNYVNM